MKNNLHSVKFNFRRADGPEYSINFWVDETARDKSITTLFGKFTELKQAYRIDYVMKVLLTFFGSYKGIDLVGEHWLPYKLTPESIDFSTDKGKDTVRVYKLEGQPVKGLDPLYDFAQRNGLDIGVLEEGVAQYFHMSRMCMIADRTREKENDCIDCPNANYINEYNCKGEPIFFFF